MILVYPKRDARAWSSFFSAIPSKEIVACKQAATLLWCFLWWWIEKMDRRQFWLVEFDKWSSIVSRDVIHFFYDLYSTFRWLFFIIHCTIMIQINYYLMIFLYSIVTFFSWAISTVKSSKLCIIIHNFKILISL